MYILKTKINFLRILNSSPRFKAKDRIAPVDLRRRKGSGVVFLIVVILIPRD